jgi:hypothetical protein
MSTSSMQNLTRPTSCRCPKVRKVALIDGIFPCCPFDIYVSIIRVNFGTSILTAPRTCTNNGEKKKVPEAALTASEFHPRELLWIPIRCCGPRSAPGIYLRVGNSKPNATSFLREWRHSQIEPSCPSTETLSCEFCQ